MPARLALLTTTSAISLGEHLASHPPPCCSTNCGLNLERWSLMYGKNSVVEIRSRAPHRGPSPGDPCTRVEAPAHARKRGGALVATRDARRFVVVAYCCSVFLRRWRAAAVSARRASSRWSGLVGGLSRTSVGWVLEAHPATNAAPISTGAPRGVWGHTVVGHRPPGMVGLGRLGNHTSPAYPASRPLSSAAATASRSQILARAVLTR